MDTGTKIETSSL